MEVWCGVKGLLNQDTHVVFFHTAPLLFAGDSRWGGNECVTGTEGGISGDRWVPICFAAALPPDPQHHRSGEELHHHFPCAYWHDAGLHKALNWEPHKATHTHTYRCIHAETNRLMLYNMHSCEYNVQPGPEVWDHIEFWYSIFFKLRNIITWSEEEICKVVFASCSSNWLSCDFVEIVRCSKSSWDHLK